MPISAHIHHITKNTLSFQGFSLVFFVLIYNQVTKAKQLRCNQQSNVQQNSNVDSMNSQRPRSVLVAYSTDDVMVTVTPLYYQSDDVTDDLFNDQPPSYEETMKIPAKEWEIQCFLKFYWPPTPDRQESVARKIRNH